MGSQFIFNILTTVALYLLIANSFSIIYFTIKFFHITHAIIISSGAYFVFLFINTIYLSFPFSVVLAIIAASILGILCEILVYKQMRKRNVPALVYLIAAIGLYVLLQNIISLYFGDDTKIINKTEITIGNHILGAYITTIQIITIIVSLGLFILISLLLNYTKIGRSIRAVASDPELSNIYGIRSNKIILIVFGIGSALASIAGILSAMDTNMTPTFGFNLLLYGVVAMIIGGVGSTRGLIAGSLLLATSQHLAAYYIDTKWMDAFAYIILIIFLIWKPLGFSGIRLKKIEV
ncbi:MAG: branched-chain amino acid ABC transporter permease [Bacteroidetes bacterium]|nr:branched-chain amino acid ABC transporter permease [Bacteroidota bacterium]